LQKKQKPAWNYLNRIVASKPSPSLLLVEDQKNKLWNKIRQEILGIPIKTIPQAETTV